MLNIHHLELFYYVARHGGISEAVRNMPYGIQQPAVSGQVILLEEYLGVTLFQRRPFELTPAGEKLFRFIEPFFSNLEAVANDIQGGTVHVIRIGASEIVLRDHFPELARNVRKKFPNLKISLREGYQPELVNWLQRQDIDFAVTLIGDSLPVGLHAVSLLRLPLVLLVEKGMRLNSAEDLWKRDKITDPLITLPANEAINRNFQAGLSRLKIDWFPAVEVSSVELIATFVANGFGIGLAVEVPGAKLPANVRALPLKGFEPVELGAIWRGKLSPVYRGLLEEIQKRAKSIAG